MRGNRREKPLGAGKSSFDLVDADKVFGHLGLKRGISFLDLGCGRGEYAIAASMIVGGEGLVYAVDLWEEGIVSLQEEVSVKGIDNLKPLIADVELWIPIDDAEVDVCLMAAMFHDLVLANSAYGALKEVVRVLKRDGSLAILEFKKIDGPPGPPLSSRLAPEEVEKKVAPHGFKKVRIADTGPYTYIIKFNR